ncbi:MAG TPA: Crp/Fnr family transcriptional regulator [Ohtaekwangia sp.]|nr:Crp/Fnr family transcriptional regulator [Ohtaekwangia sp.]
MIAEILRRNGSYSPTDEERFVQEARVRKVAKDEILVRRGEVCRSIFFNLSGAFYQYRHNDHSEEVIIDLHTPDEWFFNHVSFIGQTPSNTFVNAFVESEVLELTIESLHSLIARSSAFLQLAKVFEQATTRVHFFDHRMSPDEKYQYILDNRRALLQLFPLKHIASYLKISPETLSRVRERFSGRDALS